MLVIDPIADMLTRIRNAINNRHATVIMPTSKMKVAIAEVLEHEGYIKSFTQNGEGVEKTLTLELKYGPNHEKVIQGLKRISKPGLRIYASYEDLPKVINGLGIAIVSTSKGLLTDKQAREQKVGGEVLAYVW